MFMEGRTQKPEHNMNILPSTLEIFLSTLKIVGSDAKKCVPLLNHPSNIDQSTIKKKLTVCTF